MRSCVGGVGAPHQHGRGPKPRIPSEHRMPITPNAAQQVRTHTHSRVSKNHRPPKSSDINKFYQPSTFGGLNFRKSQNTSVNH